MNVNIKFNENWSLGIKREGGVTETYTQAARSSHKPTFLPLTKMG
jgi:hypothetical protein